ncbi:hypothetical protein CBS101457_003605 [Exobasidium rhododendri]|nr:hypothetical protein CBS101457_003605 [Exobasidium rhododendri]
MPTHSPPLGLATMAEESTDGIGSFRFPSRASDVDRHSLAPIRTNSSAATLQQADRTMTQRGNSADTFSRSISQWRGEFGKSVGGMSPGSGDQMFYQHHQHAHDHHDEYSQSYSSFQSGTMRRERAEEEEEEESERGRRFDFINSAFDSKFLEEDTLREAGMGGSESRRHSIATDPTNTAPFGQRRAIGFEVGKTHPAATSRTSSVGRQAITPRAGQFGSTLFRSGNSGFSEEDLSADFTSLHVNLDNVAARQQMQEERKRIQMRVPSNNAATSGIHAASLPLGYGDQEGPRNGHAFSPPLTAMQRNWPISARMNDEEAKSTWGDVNASPPTKSAYFDFGRGGLYQQQTSRGNNAFMSSLSRDDDRKTQLSPTAKSFQGSRSQTFSSGDGIASHQQRHQPGHPASNSVMAPSSSLYRKASQDKASELHSASPPTSSFPSFAPPHFFQDQQQQQQQQLPTLSRGNLTALSELTIASLINLGPLAPAASGGQSDGPGGFSELGKGVPLQVLPRITPLYIVEFKEGRTDLYFRQQQGGANGGNEEIYNGDLVIVEADRGKDLGTVVNDNISVDQVQSFLTHQAELAQMNHTLSGLQQSEAGGGGEAQPHPAAIPLSRLTRSINPKRLFAKAGPADTTLLHSKAQDEERALSLCTTKINQRGLPMFVVAAELQWDRRKLTFYYTATQRVDFRDLVKELFRLYKTRIWMCHLSHPSGSGLPT